MNLRIIIVLAVAAIVVLSIGDRTRLESRQGEPAFRRAVAAAGSQVTGRQSK